MRRAGWITCVLLFSLSVLAAGPEDVIMQADRDFNKATQEKRAAGWNSFFAENAALPLEKPLAGKQAISEFYEKQFANPDFTLTWDPIKGEVFPGESVGYTTGKYVARFKNKAGQMMESTGRYITVWNKQEDGSWKVVADTGGPDGPPHPVAK
jgi:ketosteroid isomerase-like protein